MVEIIFLIPLSLTYATEGAAPAVGRAHAHRLAYGGRGTDDHGLPPQLGLFLNIGRMGANF